MPNYVHSSEAISIISPPLNTMDTDTNPSTIYNLVVGACQGLLTSPYHVVVTNHTEVFTFCATLVQVFPKFLVTYNCKGEVYQ